MRVRMPGAADYPVDMSTARTVALLRAGPRGHQRLIGYAIALIGPAVVVAIFRPWRDELQPLTIGFAFLAVVVAAAIVGRLAPGLIAAVVCFLAFNFFFLPPYDTFVIARGEHVVALFVFLALSVLISLLYARAVDRADVAEAKENELEALQELSRDLVVRGPGEDTYEALLGDVVERFGFDAGALFVRTTEGELDERVVVGAASGVLTPSWNPADPGRAPERLPLSVGNRTLGLIVLVGERPPLDPAEVRVLRAVFDQLALVLERDRLLRTATDAEILRQTEIARRTMLAAVSHDLRSPLAAIKASVTDLLDPEVERSPDERDDVLRVVDREGDRLDALVANLLDLSRIEAGVVQAHLEHVDLAEVVTAEVDAAALRWPDVHMSMSIDDGHEIAIADPVFVPRIVSNLLDNAARAASAAARPDVEIRIGPTSHAEQSKAIAVRVIDHGAGLTTMERTQLFLPFSRVDERATKLGSGLGLAIAKGFIDLMDGKLWFEDTPGGGATFAFSLQEAA
jgi:two-component system, OmpR family, sensor histidine kinase KdpD